MSLFTKWFESLHMDVTVTEKCSRRKSPRSNCVECIDECDRGAISIHNNQIQIDSLTCDSCGKCVIGCPTTGLQGPLPKRTFQEGLLQYDNTSLPSKKELLIYAKKGLRGLKIKEEVTQVSSIQTLIDEVNDVLVQFQMKPLHIHVKTDQEQQLTTRRELFLGVKRQGESLVKELVPISWKGTASEFLLSSHYPEAQFYDVTLKMEKCTLCPICSNLCPQKAINLNEEIHEMVIDHSLCTNCKLCSDICPQKAISINDAIGPKTIWTHSFFKTSCTTCHSSFFTFDEEMEVCDICANKKVGWL